jgi:alpha-N-arabinofuranosidase
LLSAGTLFLALLGNTAQCAAQEAAPPAVLTIHAEPLHTGRISPLLIGNFIELLDDVVPAMWAEMLNDRSFEGVEPLAKTYYYDSAPGLCDRPWDRNATWAYDHEKPFNGSGCAKLTATPERPATLSQSGLAVGTATTYRFTGYFRADDPALTATVSLKSRLPDGTWFTLATAELPAFATEWRRTDLSLKSSGATDRAVFEVAVRGRGHVWADKLSLMPDDNVHGWRRDVVEVIRELHSPIIRWGGSVVDPGRYRWKDGIGDRDLRTPFPNKVWGRIDSNDVGIDEFCQFCEAVGSRPLVCVSFGDGAQSAGDLAQYCNGDATSTWGAKRAANGHPAPYRVRLWQVGNEIPGYRTFYLENIGKFISAIKGADPAARIMSSFPDQALLTAAGKDLSYVCPHQYTRDLAEIDSSLSKLAQMIDTTPGCGHLQIAITEWNVSGGDWGLGRARQMTLETALLNARHLHVMMRHSDKVTLATRSNMANSFCGGTIETNPGGVLKRPSYYVMDLYTRHARPLPLRVDGAPADLDVFASAAEGWESITLFVVNSSGNPHPVRLAGDKFATPLRIVNAECVADTEDARQLDAMNHWADPDRVKNRALSASENDVILPAYSITALECAPAR